MKHFNQVFEAPCPCCKRSMTATRRSIVNQTRLFVCACGYREWMTEKQFEDITGQCFICGKRDCCAKDHRFNGIIPTGMGL